MTDDIGARRRELTDSISRKGAWLEERRRNTDANGHIIDAEIDRKLAERHAGVEPVPTPEPQAPEPSPAPGDGGARHDQDQPVSAEASGLQRRIKEAEAAGDLDASMRAKGDLLRFRRDEQNASEN